jgi:hypothetical protein
MVSTMATGKQTLRQTEMEFNNPDKVSKKYEV